MNKNLETKVVERTKELEERKKDIEELNLFTYLINSLASLDEIFVEISKYVYEKYKITACWLFLPDSKKEFLYAYKIYSYHKLPEKIYQFASQLIIPLKEMEGGMFYKVFQRKKPFYLKRIPKFEYAIDKEIVEKLSIQGSLYVPLVRKKECIGIFGFSNLENEMELEKQEIIKITNLCMQISGSIDAKHLLEQIDRTRNEIQSLNLLLKQLNETNDIKIIVELLCAYIDKNYGFPYCVLAKYDVRENALVNLAGVYPSHLSGQIKKKIRDMKILINLKNEKSIHTRCILSQEPQLILDVSREVTTELGKQIHEIIKHKSWLCLPIIYQNKISGILEVISLEPNSISKEDIEKLKPLAEHLAGIINNAVLYQQVEQEKENALILKIEADAKREEAELLKEQSENLNKLIKSLNEELDLKIIMQKVHRFVKDYFAIEQYAMYKVNSAKTDIHLQEVSFPDHVSQEDRELIKSYVFDINDSRNSHSAIINKKKPLFVAKIRLKSLDKREAYIVEKCNYTSYLMIPLILDNEPIGILDFSKSSGRLSLRKDEITRLSILGEQLAGIIHGSNLFQQVQEEKEKAEQVRQEIERLNEFTKLINSISDISHIFLEVYSYLKRVFGFSHIWIPLINKQTREIYSKENMTISENMSTENMNYFKNFKMKLQPSLGTLYRTYQAKTPLYIPDITDTIPGTKNKNINQYNDEIYEGSKIDLKIILKGGFKSTIQIPLLLQNEVIGILCVSAYNEKIQITKEKLEKLFRFTNQIAGVVYNAQLLEEKERARREIEKLNEFSKEINENFDLDKMLDLIGNYITENFQIEHYFLWRVDFSGDILYPYKGTYHKSISQQNIEKFQQLTIPLADDGIHSLACQKQRNIFIRGMQKRKSNSDVENRINELLGFHCLLVIPLVIQNKMIGTMDFSHYSEKMNLTKKDIKKISIFCEQIAGVLHGASLLKEVEFEQQKSEKLLLNILPRDVARELKDKGSSEPVLFENVSVMFTDFKGFTRIAEKLTPQELIKDLDACFVQFDKISERFNLEKLKTIGDSYMCAGGIPKVNKTHALDCVMAALEIQDFMNLMKKLKEEKGFPYWELRLGIHSGPIVAGVIGEKKFAYDVWGDTVNSASRMESSGTPGKINISGATYELVKDFFDCEYRGEIPAKNKGMVQMYYVNAFKNEYSQDKKGRMPNEKFWQQYGD